MYNYLFYFIELCIKNTINILPILDESLLIPIYDSVILFDTKIIYTNNSKVSGIIDINFNVNYGAGRFRNIKRVEVCNDNDVISP